MAREPFHLEKNGGLQCHGVSHFICKNLTGNYREILALTHNLSNGFLFIIKAAVDRIARIKYL
jgi:hypothetical protein